MNKQIIIKLDSHKFESSWTDPKYKDSNITMDFLPIIEKFELFELKDSFCLLHWQSKPKGLRRWGVYDNNTQQYYSMDHDKLIISEEIKSQTLQIDENLYKTKPTAVILFKGFLKIEKPFFYLQNFNKT